MPLPSYSASQVPKIFAQKDVHPAGKIRVQNLDKSTLFKKFTFLKYFLKIALKENINGF